jgi:hypothetical protein
MAAELDRSPIEELGSRALVRDSLPDQGPSERMQS